MKAQKNNLKICYIGGGSRNWAWVFMKDLAFEHEIGGTIWLYDVQPEAAMANETIGNTLMASHNPGQWKFKAEPSLQRALEGSDFVFISILPGDFDKMAIDVHSPEKYGIYQSVGDTVGPGGLNRALRVVPLYQKIAQAIKNWAPDAWVLNYTNPMTVCTRTLYQEFPEIKAFGCCHEVFGTQKLLMAMIRESGIAEGQELRREDIITRVIGINHFTWIDQATWKDLDLMPIYAQFAEKYAEKGFEEGGDKNWLNSFFESCERVKFDLFRRYNCIAAAGDRHLAEFCPPSWYLSSPEKVKEWKYSLTPVSFRVEKREELKQMSRGFRDGSEVMVPEDSGEEGIRQIKALLGLGNIVTNVNVPNRGQMPDLPLGAVVETNALFCRDSVQPVLTEGMPNCIRNLTLAHVINQEGIVEAARERNLTKAFQVFLNDPQLKDLEPQQAKALFVEMTRATLDPEYGYDLSKVD